MDFLCGSLLVSQEEFPRHTGNEPPARRGGNRLLRRKHLQNVAAVCLLLSLAGVASAQNALERVRQKGELTIATDATYPPFEFKQNGQLTGFDIELGGEIAKELGVKVNFLSLEWAGVLGALESGKCDLVMSGVTITDERKNKGYLFSRPYFLSGQTIARRKGDTRIRSLEDLKDKIASVQAETTGQFALEKAGVPKDRILKFDQLQDGLTDTRNRKSDATVADLPVLKRILRQGYPDLELVGEIPVKENLGIVAWKTAPELRDAVNDALTKILADGRYAALYQKWMDEPATPAMLAELDKVRDAGTATIAPSAAPSSASLLREALPQLLNGAKLTLFLTFLTLLIGTPAGLFVALLRISHLSPLKILATTYVEIVRGTPLLMQIYVIYFVLPRVGLQFSPLIAGILALSLNAAAYISEIFRAGIESIDVGQMEAARSLGMNYAGAMRWIILPQTLRRVLPPLTNEAVALLKDSSLVSVVALSELMRVGKELATNSGEPTLIYLTVALFYLTMTLPLTFLVRRLERAWQPVSRKT
jgi:His/Glu/Gln/Arg/opine family amino acid ABC transporter permease subunit